MTNEMIMDIIADLKVGDGVDDDDALIIAEELLELRKEVKALLGQKITPENPVQTSDMVAGLNEISKQTGRSMTEIVRLGLGLVKMVLDEQRQNKYRLVIADSNLKPLREIVLPIDSWEGITDGD
jgi:hypothetical protein